MIHLSQKGGVMGKIAILIACAALAGCGASASSWIKAGATEAQTQQALAECKYEASKATAAVRDGLEGGLKSVEIRNQCMGIKGFQPRS
jgi:hypothetical protein